MSHGDGDPHRLQQKGHIFGSPVEVLLEPDVWHVATLLHLSRPGWVVVQVESAEKEIAMNQVRMPPPPSDNPSEPFIPKLNDLVEVQVTHPKPCILSGAVRMARGPYFLVSFLGRGRQDDLLVQAEQLREPGRTTLLSTCLLQEEVFELPPGLIESGVHGEELADDLKGWLLRFQEQSRVLSLELRFTAFGAELKLAGERRQMSLAGKLLHCIHMQNWNEIARRRSELREMESRLSCLEGESREEGKFVEFDLDADIMRLILAQNGRKLQELQDSLAVRIEVRFDRRKGNNSVRIMGQDPENVAAAQRLLQYSKKILRFPRQHLGYVLGKQLSNVHELAEKVGLLSARFDPYSQALEVIGLSEQLESAELLIQAHLDYRQVYEEMQQEHGALTQSFEALDEEYRMRKGKGRGKGHPTRQYRARTPPPTAKMIALGRLQKPPSREADTDWRGNQNRVFSHPSSRRPESREKAKGAGKDKMNKGAQEEGADGVEASSSPSEADTSPNEDEQDELIPEEPRQEPDRADTPELDEDSDSNAVPSFLFDSSP
ncbi:unnamed protein product [Durusdinium trenchii]|uniref:K Homology domain-containing protein n=3 Tax=Durusdinium trenchii TaxID=1381693 RepID=A0ABP0IEK4_9DINO